MNLQINKRLNRALTCLIAVGVLAISAIVSSAQTTTGNLSGVVTDSNGAAVAGALQISR